MSIDYRKWQSCEHDDEPRDQQIDFDGPYWAQVGPDARKQPDGWSWTILFSDNITYDDFQAAFGFAPDEATAKAECERVGRWLSGKPSIKDRIRVRFGLDKPIVPV